jgi:phosphoenolpyruvate-protein kinase (PTS system EI component)
VIPEPIEQAITEYGLAAAYAGRYNDSHYRADEMKTERAALVAAIEAEIEKRDAWRQAVDDQLVLIYAPFVDDPKEALHRIISWHSDVAVDPAVSADARALIRRGAEAMQQRVVENCRNMAKAYATARGQPTAAEAATFLADAFEAFDPETPK